MNDMWRNPSYYQPFGWPGRTYREEVSGWPEENGFSAPEFGVYGDYQTQQVIGTRWPENLAYREAAQPCFWMPGRDEEWENEQDIEYFMGLYPSQTKTMQRYVEGICDHFDYDGSPMYDEIPDRITMTRLRDMALQNAGEDETLFGKKGYFGEPGCGAAKDMAEILLYHEIVRRRRQKRGML